MRDRHRALARRYWVALATVLVLAGVVLAQQPQQRPNRGARGRVRDQGGVPLKKARPEAGDPLGKAVGIPARPVPGSFHYMFRIRSFDGAPLAASYYPSKLGSSAPAVMLVHEMGRSRKDFEEAVLELKGQGLAEHLQELGYAVLTMDLRGQGQNPRRALTANERPQLVEDLQAGYFFLVDRHNRGDLNLAKLGVIALGDSANLVGAWAIQPGAAVTTEGRASDLNALVLVSPMPEGFGYVLGHIAASLAPRVPLLIMAGERDNATKDAAQSVRHLVERERLNKVELFPSAFRGYKLLRLEPKVTSTLSRFLETSLKLRPVDWEPQYNLTPVTLADIPQMVLNARPADPMKNQAKDEAKAKDAAAPAEKKADAPKNVDEEKAAPKQPPQDPPPPPKADNPN
jgi:alpha-beta hydrolase superfamily lysophospholipase